MRIEIQFGFCEAPIGRGLICGRRLDQNRRCCVHGDPTTKSQIEAQKKRARSKGLHVFELRVQEMG
jgi:hypothetical protein